MTLPKDIDPHLIGLWRFREVGQPRLWCATYCYRGRYYDVAGQPTLDAALAQVRAGVARLRSRSQRQARTARSRAA